jgi:hypothetical protein
MGLQVSKMSGKHPLGWKPENYWAQKSLRRIKNSSSFAEKRVNGKSLEGEDCAIENREETRRNPVGSKSYY